jgi:diguanylate cyclase (GGDEF)-like protein
MDIFNQVQLFGSASDSSSDVNYEKSFASANMPIAIKGVKDEIIYMNEQAKILSNHSGGSIFISYDEKLPDDIIRINELTGLNINKKVDLKTPSGRIDQKFFRIDGITLLNKFGLFSGTLFIFNEFTAAVKHFFNSNAKQGINNCVFDEITGLMLKSQFKEFFSRETERAERYRIPLSAAIFYFENLVFFGQSFGNEKLNQVLKYIGLYFKQKLRKTDIIFRMDFNDFIGILPHTNYENADKKFKKIKEEFNMLLKFPENVRPKFIYGISELNLKKHYKNYELIIEEAKLDMSQRNSLSVKQDTGYTF